MNNDERSEIVSEIDSEDSTDGEPDLELRKYSTSSQLVILDFTTASAN
jgi:hypothetical protein